VRLDHITPKVFVICRVTCKKRFIGHEIELKRRLFGYKTNDTTKPLIEEYLQI